MSIKLPTRIVPQANTPPPPSGSKALNRLVPYILTAPAAVCIALFILAPLVIVLVLSVFNLNLVTGTSSFTGLDNFIAEFENEAFTNSLRNTLLYALYTVIPSMALGLGVALLINGLTHGQGFWRSLYFLPVASTLVAMSAVWRWMFQADTGVVDRILGPVLGIHDWLSDPNLALIAVSVVGNWHQIGLVAILYLAALGGLPRDQYDSAVLDGAGGWNQFWHVTWPSLGPTTIFAFILTCSAALQAYDVIAAMTQGGPLGSTETLTYSIWLRGVHYFDIGRAAVLSLALLVLSLLVTMLQRSGYAKRLEQAGTR